MRKLTLSICICFFAFMAKAQTSPIMVCNSTGTICAPYYNLDTAIFYANSGDYIYLPGGNLNINIPLGKEIHMKGAGTNLDSSLTTLTTIVNGNLKFTDTISNSSFEGFQLNGSVSNFSNTPKLINAIFKRMVIGNINNYNAVNNLAFSNCIFMQSRIGVIWNITNTLNTNIIQNCYLNYIYGCSNLTIKNSVFLGEGNGNGTSCSAGGATIYNSSSLIIKNSIFLEDVGWPNWYPCGGAPGWTPYDIYANNNLFLKGVASVGFALNQNNITSFCASNFSNGCPVLPFNFDTTFQISVTAPSHNAGDDGTDIGVFGGSTPWKMGSIPSNPHIYYKLIIGTTNTNGDLPVNIKARGEN